MAMSKIEWTDRTWNPVTGCTKISPGCAHCYAESFTLRFHRGPAFLPGKTEIQIHTDRLEQPLHWRKPERVFVCSMSDLFHDDVPARFIAKIFGVMFQAPHLTFQILTKRPERMRELLNDMRFWWDVAHSGPSGQRIGFDEMAMQIPNAHLGVSVENQYWADRRIPLLLKTPGALHWLSIEPLLKPVDLTKWLEPDRRECLCPDSYLDNNVPLKGCMRHDVLNAPGWVVVGGESGPSARAMHPQWARNIRDQCQAVGVPFFFKQWGAWCPVFPSPYNAVPVSKKAYTNSAAVHFDTGIASHAENKRMAAQLYEFGYELMAQRDKKAAGWLLDGVGWREFPNDR